VTSPIIKSRFVFIREGIFAMKISALPQQLDHEKKAAINAAALPLPSLSALHRLPNHRLVIFKQRAALCDIAHYKITIRFYPRRHFRDENFRSSLTT